MVSDLVKTTLELPDHLMRAVKILAAQTDRKLKDVIADVIQRGLTGSAEGVNPIEPTPSRKGDALDALFAAGDELVSRGVDIKAWAAGSRDVWR